MGVVTYSNFGDRIISEVRDGEERDYVRDTLGSTAELVDETGTVTDTFEYWPYGEVRMRSGTTTAPFGFVGTLGYFTDSLLRLYVRARVFCPSNARWLTSDPLWPRQHPYTYVDGRAQEFADPSGLFALIPIACAVSCGGCLVCLAGAASACSDCKTLQCWTTCLAQVIAELPNWVKSLCGAACAGCLLCVMAALVETCAVVQVLRNPHLCADDARDCYTKCVDDWRVLCWESTMDYNICRTFSLGICRCICG